MEEINLVKQANKLSVDLTSSFTDNADHTTFGSALSPEYVIGSAVKFRVRVFTTSVQGGYRRLVCVQLVKLRADDNLIYTIKLTSTKMKINDKSFTSDDGTWHLVYDTTIEKWRSFQIDVLVWMDIAPSSSSYVSLHGDTALTDLTLRGEGGLVQVHRVVAATSPVLSKVVGGIWRDTNVGSMDVPGVSCTTLQHLKDYVYLNTLPETGLEQVLLLASYYKIPELEQKCVHSLMRGLTPQNIWEMLEFTAKHKCMLLLKAILEAIQTGAVNMPDNSDNND